MIKIGITGQAGFIGTHLYNTLSLHPDKYIIIPFRDEFFKSEEVLDAFVKLCDVIVHLAAMNRHNDPNVLYKTNIELVQKLIASMERTKSKPYVIMSSSLQEERDNVYGLSKKEGRELFNQWAERNGAKFTGLIIPNVFGPFGVPFYNSVISTFSYQICNKQEPKIEVDNELKLIYVGDLVKVIISLFPADYAEKNTDYAKKKTLKTLKTLRALRMQTLRTLRTLRNGYHQEFWKCNIGQNIRFQNYWINSRPIMRPML